MKLVNHVNGNIIISKLRIIVKLQSLGHLYLLPLNGHWLNLQYLQFLLKIEPKSLRKRKNSFLTNTRLENSMF